MSGKSKCIMYIKENNVSQYRVHLPSADKVIY